jgi:hypothetical protein
MEINSGIPAGFEALKIALTSAPVLVYFQEERSIKLETDASNGVISGALFQLDNQGNWHPVAFYLKTISSAECNYFIHDKKLLAIVRSF